MAGFRLQDHADAFAAAQLIPRRYESRLGQLETESDVFLFAEEVGIPPGIVVGRLQRGGKQTEDSERRTNLGQQHIPARHALSLCVLPDVIHFVNPS